MKIRTGMGMPALLMLAIVLTCFALSSWPVTAAEDTASLAAEIAVANRGSGAITLSRNITLNAALPPITGSVTIDGGGHSISGNETYRLFDVNGGTLNL